MDDIELNPTHLRDVSFSSYLSMVGENFAVNLPERGQSPLLVPARGLQTPRRAQTQVGELGVFAAERYYNMGVHHDHQEHNEDQSNTRKLGYNNHVTRTPNPRNLTTPSVSSEASSWNSQSALMLANTTKRKKAISSSRNSFFSGLGCNGRSCSDKDSVITVDHHRKPTRKSEVDPKLIVFDGTKQSLPRIHHAKNESVILRSPMSIASSSNISESLSHRLAPSIPNFIRPPLQLEPRINDDHEFPRISLEVFGSSKVKKAADVDDVVSVSLEKKLSMLTWDAIPKSQSMTTKTKSVSHDEVGSDASSDLFEIENISSHNGSSSQHQRIGRYEGTMTPTSAYEPSEASIEWSVVTASAADFSGNNLDYDEKRLSENANKNMGKSGGGGQRSGILGCKSHKAVRVVEPAPISSYRTSVPGALAGAGNDKLGTRSHLLH